MPLYSLFYKLPSFRHCKFMYVKDILRFEFNCKVYSMRIKVGRALM